MLGCGDVAVCPVEEDDYARGDLLRHRRKRVKSARYRKLHGRLFANRTLIDMLAEVTR